MTLDLEVDGRAPVGGGIGELFQPDMTAAADYLDGLKRQTAPTPESDLALAVLEDAVACLQKFRNSAKEKERRIFLETEAWVDENDREWFFSFLNVCDFLGLDPDYLRRGLRQETSDRSAVNVPRPNSTSTR